MIVSQEARGGAYIEFKTFQNIIETFSRAKFNLLQKQRKMNLIKFLKMKAFWKRNLENMDR